MKAKQEQAESPIEVVKPVPSPSPLKLNLGCGDNKIMGFINIDAEASVKPDVQINFVSNKLPYNDNTVEEVALFHTIEHIRKLVHIKVLTEIWRVLKPGGAVYISYPEFTRCYDNWKSNFRGKREFWEATIYGRQFHASDFHVCIMHTPDFTQTLLNCGFDNIHSIPEPAPEEHNTALTAVKFRKPVNYEDLVKDGMERIVIVNGKEKKPK